jgi:hypothetical protein
MGRNVEASNDRAATYLPAESVEALNMTCHYCSSQNVRWFTPRSYADRAAVLLCMACRRLTIVPPRALRAAQRDESKQAA